MNLIYLFDLKKEIIIYSQKRFDRVISMDWLGMGGSSRPRCGAAPRLSLLSGWCSANTMDPTKATDFFIDSLEVKLFLEC